MKWARFFAIGLVAFGGLIGRAKAGGPYAGERGTRNLSRGGAYVAGAEGPDSLWTNPAGASMGDPGLAVDLSLYAMWTRFQRYEVADFSSSQSWSLPVPLPGIQATIDPGWGSSSRLGAALFIPPGTLPQWSSPTADADRPHRYGLLSSNGTWQAYALLSGSFKPLDWLALGLNAGAVFGAYNVTATQSGCDGVLCSYPEDVAFDATARLEVPFYISPSFNIGAIATHQDFRFGVSWTSPVLVRSQANLHVTLPPSSAFDGAYLRTRDGECATAPDNEVETAPSHPCRNLSADFAVNLPWTLRVGAEWRMASDVRAELALQYESWSDQQEIVSNPRSLWLINGFGGVLDYPFGPTSVRRNQTDSVAVRLGTEWRPNDGLTLVAGGFFESSSMAPEWTSILGFDSNKVGLSVGATFALGDELSLLGAAGYTYYLPQNVRTSQVRQTNPIDSSQASVVGNGLYEGSVGFFSLGLTYRPRNGPAIN